MSEGFIIPAKVQVSVGDLSQVAAKIRNGIAGVNANVGVNIDPSSLKSLDNVRRGLSGLNGGLAGVNNAAVLVSSSLKDIGGPGTVSNVKQLDSQLGKTIRNLEGLKSTIAGNGAEIQRFGALAGVSARRFLAFGAVASVFYAVSSATKEGIGEAAKFQRELVRIQQVGGDSAATVARLGQEVANLGKTLGVSANELIETGTTLRQAGLSADETATALGALAKTSLAPTFKDLKNTTEGVIALRQQFGISGKDIEESLGSINTVSAQFAVESEDLVQAIQRTGGAFRAASSDLTPAKEQFNQLLGIFTSVRQTTRESAESISTSLRTIFARLQSSTVQNNLKELGIELRATSDDAQLAGRNIEGQFVGADEAIKRLSASVKGIPTTDPRFAAIVNQIGGQRQVSKVIPLLQQYEVAQKAFNVAQAGTTSLTRDADKAQESFLNKVTKLKEEFNDLVRVFSNNKGLNTFIDFALKGASAAITLTKALEPILPLVFALGAVKLASVARVAVPAAVRGFATGSVGRFATGGVIPGVGSGDTVPHMAEAGDFVIRKVNAQKFGYANLDRLTNVPVTSGSRGSVPVMLEPKEYYVPREIAQVIGYNNLKHINETGTLPGRQLDVRSQVAKAEKSLSRGYATGGDVRRPKPLSSHMSDYYSPTRQNFNEILKGRHGDEISSAVGNAHLIGSGTDAVAFRDESGEVIRISGLGGNNRRTKEFLARGGRPKDKFTLQPTSSKQVGDHIIERLPYAPSLGDASPDRKDKAVRGFEKRLFANGLVPTDLIPENLGRHGNKIVAIDAETYKKPASADEFEEYLAYSRFRGDENLKKTGLKAAGYATGGPITKRGTLLKELSDHNIKVTKKAFSDRGFDVNPEGLVSRLLVTPEDSMTSVGRYAPDSATVDIRAGMTHSQLLSVLAHEAGVHGADAKAGRILYNRPVFKSDRYSENVHPFNIGANLGAKRVLPQLTHDGLRDYATSSGHESLAYTLGSVLEKRNPEEFNMSGVGGYTGLTNVDPRVENFFHKRVIPAISQVSKSPLDVKPPDFDAFAADAAEYNFYDKQPLHQLVYKSGKLSTKPYARFAGGGLISSSEANFTSLSHTLGKIGLDHINPRNLTSGIHVINEEGAKRFRFNGGIQLYNGNTTLLQRGYNPALDPGDNIPMSVAAVHEVLGHGADTVMGSSGFTASQTSRHPANLLAHGVAGSPYFPMRAINQNVLHEGFAVGIEAIAKLRMHEAGIHKLTERELRTLHHPRMQSVLNHYEKDVLPLVAEASHRYNPHNTGLNAADAKIVEAHLSDTQGFGVGDAGHFATGGMVNEPNPINTRKLEISRFGNNGGRARRYSLDAPRASYYAKHRSIRFSDALQSGRVNEHISLLEERFARYADKKHGVTADAGYAKGGVIDFAENKSRIQRFANLLGRRHRLDDKSRRLADDYVSHSGAYNDKNDPLYDSKRSDQLNEAVGSHTLPGNIVLYRGINGDNIAGLGATRASKLVGKTHISDRLVSTTLNPDTAKSFGSTTLRIMASKGTRGTLVNPNEQEFLLPKGAAFHFESYDKDSNTLNTRLVDGYATGGVIKSVHRGIGGIINNKVLKKIDGAHRALKDTATGQFFDHTDIAELTGVAPLYGLMAGELMARKGILHLKSKGYNVPGFAKGDKIPDDKVKVSDLAKQLGVSSADFIRMANDAGFPEIKHHANRVSASFASELNDRIRGVSPVVSQPEVAETSAITPEKRARNESVFAELQKRRAGNNVPTPETKVVERLPIVEQLEVSKAEKSKVDKFRERYEAKVASRKRAQEALKPKDGKSVKIPKVRVSSIGKTLGVHGQGLIKLLHENGYSGIDRPEKRISAELASQMISKVKSSRVSVTTPEGKKPLTVEKATTRSEGRLGLDNFVTEPFQSDGGDQIRLANPKDYANSDSSARLVGQLDAKNAGPRGSEIADKLISYRSLVPKTGPKLDVNSSKVQERAARFLDDKAFEKKEDTIPPLNPALGNNFGISNLFGQQRSDISANPHFQKLALEATPSIFTPKGFDNRDEALGGSTTSVSNRPVETTKQAYENITRNGGIVGARIKVNAVDPVEAQKDRFRSRINIRELPRFAEKPQEVQSAPAVAAPVEAKFAVGDADAVKTSSGLGGRLKTRSSDVGVTPVVEPKIGAVSILPKRQPAVADTPRFAAPEVPPSRNVGVSPVAPPPNNSGISNIGRRASSDRIPTHVHNTFSNIYGHGFDYNTITGYQEVNSLGNVPGVTLKGKYSRNSRTIQVDKNRAGDTKLLAHEATHAIDHAAGIAAGGSGFASHIENHPLAILGRKAELALITPEKREVYAKLGKTDLRHEGLAQLGELYASQRLGNTSDPRLKDKNVQGLLSEYHENTSSVLTDVAASTRADKLRTVAERGGTANEREIARKKLASLGRDNLPAVQSGGNIGVDPVVNNVPHEAKQARRDAEQRKHTSVEPTANVGINPAVTPPITLPVITPLERLRDQQKRHNVSPETLSKLNENSRENAKHKSIYTKLASQVGVSEEDFKRVKEARVRIPRLDEEFKRLKSSNPSDSSLPRQLPAYQAPSDEYIHPHQLTGLQIADKANKKAAVQSGGDMGVNPVTNNSTTSNSPKLTPNQQAARDFFASNPEGKKAREKAELRRQERIRGKTAEEHIAAETKRNKASSTFTVVPASGGSGNNVNNTKVASGGAEDDGQEDSSKPVTSTKKSDKKGKKRYRSNGGEADSGYLTPKKSDVSELGVIPRGNQNEERNFNSNDLNFEPLTKKPPSHINLAEPKDVQEIPIYDGSNKKKRRRVKKAESLAFHGYGLESGFTNEPIGRTSKSGVTDDQFNSLAFNQAVLPDRNLLNPGGRRGYINSQLHNSSANGTIFNRRTGEFEYKRGVNFSTGHQIYTERFTEERQRRAEKIREDRRKSRGIDEALGLDSGRREIPLDDLGDPVKNIRKSRADQIRYLRSQGHTRASIHDILHGDLTEAKTSPISPQELHQIGKSTLRSRAYHGLSNVGNKIGGLGFGGVIAGQGVASSIQSFTGSVEEPNKSSAFGVAGAKYGAATSGAITGAITGATIGSVGGGPGIAIGAAVGAIGGFVISLKDAEQRIKAVQLDKDLKKFGEALQDISSGKEITSTVLASTHAGLSAISKSVSDETPTYATKGYGALDFFSSAASKNEDFNKNLKSKLDPYVPQLQETGNRIAANIRFDPKTVKDGLAPIDVAANKQNRISAFGKAGLTPIASSLAEAKGVSVKEILDAFDKVAVEATKSRLAFDSNTKVVVRATADFQSFVRIGQAVEFASNSMKDLEDKTGSLSAAFDGVIKSASVHNFSDFTQFGTPNKDEFSKSVDFVSNSFGGTVGKSFGDTARGFNDAATELPGIISQSNAGGVDGEGLASNIVKGLSHFPKEVQEKLSEAVAAIDPVELAKQASENVQKLSERLIGEVAGAFGDSFTKSAKIIEDKANAFGEGLALNQTYVNRTGESRDKLDELHLGASQLRRKARATAAGRPSDDQVSLSQLLAPSRRSQERLTGLTGNDAVNPEKIATALRQKQGEAEGVREQIKNKDNAHPETIRPLTTEFNKLNGEANRLEQALKNLTDPLRENAAIQEKINKIDSDRAGRLNFSEKLATASPSDLHEIRKSAFATNVAVSQGHFNDFSAKNRSRVLEHLSSLGDAVVTPDGRSASDVKEHLTRNLGVAAGVIDPRQDRVKAGLLNRQADNADTAVKAQGILVETQETRQKQFFDNLDKGFAEFFNKLSAGQIESKKKDLLVEKGQATGDLNKVQRAYTSLDGLNKHGLNTESARSLASNPDFVKFQDLTKNTRTLARDKDALKKNLTGADADGDFDAKGIYGLKEDSQTKIARKISENLPGVSQSEAREKFVNPFVESVTNDDRFAADKSPEARKKRVETALNRNIEDFTAKRQVNLATSQTDLQQSIASSTFNTRTPTEAQRGAIGKAALDEDFSKKVKGLGDFRTDNEIAGLHGSATARQRTAESREQELSREAPRPIPTNPSVPVVAAEDRATRPNIVVPPEIRKIQAKLAKYRNKGENTQLKSFNNSVKAANTPPSTVPLDIQKIQKQLPKYRSVTEKKKLNDFVKSQRNPQSTQVAATPPRVRKSSKGKLAERRGESPQTRPPEVAKPPVTQENPASNLNTASGNLNGAVGNISSAIDNLSKVLASFPKELVLKRDGKIEVVLNGAEVMKAIQGDLAKVVGEEVLASVTEKLPGLLSNLPATA